MYLNPIEKKGAAAQNKVCVNTYKLLLAIKNTLIMFVKFILNVDGQHG